MFLDLLNDLRRVAEKRKLDVPCYLEVDMTKLERTWGGAQSSGAYLLYYS